MVTGGLIAHPIDAAPELLRFYRDAVADVSDDLTVFAGLVPGAGRLGQQALRAGDLPRRRAGGRRAGARAVQGVRLAAGDRGRPDALPGDQHACSTTGFPKGSLNYWLSSFTKGLSDALIDTAVERYASVPSPMTPMLFEHFHGAVTRVEPTATAVPHREPGWNLLIPSVWTDPADTDANIAWTKETHAALKPELSERRWLNYLGDDQGDDAIRGAYGPNYDRLREVKRRYDPENVFHLNHNIAP